MEKICKNCKYYCPVPEDFYEFLNYKKKKFGFCPFINRIYMESVYDEDGGLIGLKRKYPPKDNCVNITFWDPTYYVFVGENFGCIHFKFKEK